MKYNYLKLSLILLSTLVTQGKIIAAVENFTALTVIEAIREQQLETKAQLSIVNQSKEKWYAQKGNFDLKLESDWKQIDKNSEYSEFNFKLNQPIALFGLNVWGGYRATEGNLPSYWPWGATAGSGEFSLGASLPLLKGFLLDQRRWSEKNSFFEYQIKQNEFDQKIINSIEKGLHLYIQWLLAKKRTHIAQELLNIAVKRGEWIQTKVNAGLLAQFDVQENQRSILHRKTTLIDFKNRESIQWQELSLYLNWPYDQLIHAPEYKEEEDHSLSQFSTPPQGLPELEQHLNNINAFRKDLVAGQQLIAAKELKKDLAKQSLLPSLTLTSEVVQQQGTTTLYDEEEYRIMMKFEVPLWQREARGNVAAAQQEISQAQLSLQQLQQQLSYQAHILSQNFQATSQRYGLLEQEVLLATELQEGENKRLAFGDSNLLMVNIREQNTAEAKIKRQEVLAELWKQYVSYYALSGEIAPLNY